MSKEIGFGFDDVLFFFVIIGIDLLYLGNNFCLKINEIGCRLVMFVKKWGVLFEYVVLVGSWELFIVRDMNLREDEVFVVLL